MIVAPFFVDFHHFLSIFTIFYRFSRFTHFCRDLHFVAIYALFPQNFFGQNSLLRNITRFLHVWGGGAYRAPPSPPGTFLRITVQIHVRAYWTKLDFSQLWVWKRAVRFSPNKIIWLRREKKKYQNFIKRDLYKLGQQKIKHYFGGTWVFKLHKSSWISNINIKSVHNKSFPTPRYSGGHCAPPKYLALPPFRYVQIGQS